VHSAGHPPGSEPSQDCQPICTLQPCIRLTPELHCQLHDGPDLFLAGVVKPRFVPCGK
jgi:hypothetical protein